MAIITESNGDASADSGTRYSLSLGDVFQGSLDPAGDKDWVRVELAAGIIYDITLTDVESAQLQLLDAEGNHLVSGGSLPAGAKLIFSPDVTGTYYIQTGSSNNDFSGDYDLTLVENTIPVGSYDEIADYLTDGYWESLDGSRAAFPVEPGGTLTADISVLTEEGRQLARWAFEAWTNVTGISFEFVEDNNADILFKSESDITASGGPAAIRNGMIISSGVNIPPDYVIENGITIDSFSFYTFMHEIGHALGLGHPGPYPTDFDNPVATYGIETIYLIDSYQASIMSYIRQAENTYINASNAANVTPMIADIIAIQNLYGVPTDINTGDTVYGYQSTVDGYLGQFFELWTGELNPFLNIGLVDYTSAPTIKPTLTDLDGDGDLDLVVGSRGGAIHYFENTGTSANPGFTERNGTDNPLESISVGSYSTPSFTDLDGDGDLDLIVGNGNGDIAYFEHTGTATAPGFTQRSGAANPFDTITKGSWSTVALADLDGDGDLDLAVGTNDGDVRYYENTGTSANPEFISRTGETNPLNNINAGSYSTPVFVDFDNDNDPDLVVGSGNENIHYFENTGTTTDPGFTQRADFDNPLLGANGGGFVAPAFADLNGDGELDLIIGNQVGSIAYFKNTGTHADPEFSPQSLANPTTLTIYDNGGTDTLDLRTDTNDQRVYLRPEGISDVYGLTGNLSIARDTVIENVIAGSGDDLVFGNAVANTLSGRDGDDRLWGSGGNDTLNGNDGDDTLYGGPGADTLDGGAGSDTASYQNSAVAVLVRLHNASAVRNGDAAGDTLTGIEHLVGSRHNDILAGDGGDNRLEGGDGNDDLYGGPAGGDDMMYGGNGDDRVFGGRGNDTLTGGAGSDILKGGPGDDIIIVDGDDIDILYGGPDNDTFRFFPSDVGGGSIRDFTDGEDVIDLTEFTDISSMADLDIVSHGDNVRIAVSGTDYLTTIILSDFDVTNLDNSDFLF